MRKIVQIVLATSDDEFQNNYFYALCNDSTVWIWNYGDQVWVRVTSSIPQN